MAIKDLIPTPADQATNELLKTADLVIKNYFGQQFGKRQLEIHKTEKELQIRDMLVTGLALRMNTLEISKAILLEFPDWAAVDPRGKSKVDLARKEYGELIDELYVAMATRIGDIYRFTDKMYRLKVYNDLAESIHRYFKPRVDIGLFDKETIAVGSLLVKILDRTNAEMSDNFGMRNRPKEQDPQVSPKEAEKLLKEKYGDQLPPGVSIGISKETVEPNDN